MESPIRSVLNIGSDGVMVDVECHISRGLPGMIIVGLGNKAVDEAKERIRSAFATSGLELPKQRVTINLAPADVPKESTSLDLPIALSILQSSRQLKKSAPPFISIGELGLDGRVRPVRGIIGKLLAAKKNGANKFFIPSGNATQALAVPGITFIPISTLRELVAHLSGEVEIQPPSLEQATLPQLNRHKSAPHHLSDIVGQARAKRAAEIAVAGGHNLFLSGPPGTGKSMLAKALPSIMPQLSTEEMLEITHLHSLTNHNFEHLVAERPFRSPHHTSSRISIIGGGHSLRPGEISLSHRGILFLDELPEFDRVTLEALRQPLEDRVVTIARVKDAVTYPADFILVATANPCPCGYFGSNKTCECSAQAILRYKRKVSGPILDRIDLHVEVEDIAHDQLLSDKREGDDDSIVRGRVQKARETQARRFSSTHKLNTAMDNREIKRLTALEPAAKELLDKGAASLDISARGYMRTIRVARTIADLEGAASVQASHIAEALQYRPQPAPVT